MKQLYLIILSIVFSTGAFSQQIKRNWDEGELTWNDFQERDIFFDRNVSEIKYYIGYQQEKEKYNDTVFIRLKSFAYMDPQLSWVNPEFKSDAILKYNQVIFDIAELYRRQLQYDLDRLNNIYDAETRFQLKYQELGEEVARFQQLSDFGRNTVVIQQWKANITERLRLYKNGSLPNYEKANFGIGLNLGIAGSFKTGSLKEHFGFTPGFAYGFDFAIKNSMIYLNGTLSGGKVNKAYNGIDSWMQDQKYGLAIIEVSYGYAIIDNANLKLAPFAGLGITEFTESDYDAEENDLRIVDYNILFGLNADYKIRRRISTVPNLFFGNRDVLETAIRARLYVAKSDFYTDLNGYTINLSLGVSWFGRMLKLQ